MDKKNFTIGALLLIAAFGLLFFGPKAPPPTAPAPLPAPEQSTATAPSAPAQAPGTAATPGQPGPPPASVVTAAFAAVNQESADATITTLSNGYIEARFTDFGGALREVAFTKRDEKNRLVYPDKLGGDTPYVFNALHAHPILAFVDYPGLDKHARFERVSQTTSEVVYRAVLDNRLEVTRRYVLSPGKSDTSDPYLIRHETTLRNLTDATSELKRIGFALGTAAPTQADPVGVQLTTGYNNGDDRKFIPRSDLESSSGFLGIGAHTSKPFVATPGPLVWTAVKNQFFASILTGTEPATGLITQRVKLLVKQHDEDPSAYGIAGISQFDVKPIGPKAEAKIAGSIYVGPKEYRRLARPAAFKADEDKVMDFGFFRFFSEILLTLMTWFNGVTHNWGIAIILTTLSLKTVFIPFTLAASKSAKRMAKIQPELQAIREKHKDNPQKQQQATMELFKTRKINPVGGCFPILLTIPFFMGFFTMLGSAAELRFQPFLWAPDLSSPDTVAVLFGFLPINIMPVLMGATMVIQMKLTPSPSVDNMQMKMMQFMPYIFAAICYNFSCALSLYSFVNGLFTIAQQLVINRMKDPDEAGPVGAGTAAASTVASWGGKKVKNVTPPKKKLK